MWNRSGLGPGPPWIKRSTGSRKTNGCPDRPAFRVLSRLLRRRSAFGSRTRWSGVVSLITRSATKAPDHLQRRTHRDRLGRVCRPNYRYRYLFLLVFLVPRRGLEPPRLAALLPESSASTNSAIWARGRRRGNKVGGGEGQRENVRIAAWPCLASHRTNGARTTGNKQSARATHRARPIDIHARRRRPPQPACAPCPRDIRST